MLMIVYIIHRKIKAALFFLLKEKKSTQLIWEHQRIPILNTAQKPEKSLR